MTIDAPPRHRVGRAPATTHDQISDVALNLFLEQGFTSTTIEDIAAQAGVSRRTIFRYFGSKNDLPWGNFDGLLDSMREHLTNIDTKVPISTALRHAIVEFNTYPEAQLSFHRSRMDLLLNVPSLNAHSTIRYAAWRQVISEYVAYRRDEDARSLAPQSIAWACLGLSLGAYEQWLSDEFSDLSELLDSSFMTAETVFGSSHEEQHDARS